MLQIFFWVLWLGSFVAMYYWSQQGFGAKEEGLCWPHFPNCKEWRFFSEFPASYGSYAFYLIIFCLLLGQGFFLLKERWVAAMAVASGVLFWQIFCFFFLTYSIPANFEYFHMGLSATFLWSANKKIFCQRVLVLLYFLSATLKWHESWILGTYFSALDLGLPFVPRNSIPFFTNFVILLETLAPLLLLKNNRCQRVVFWFFVFFHLYSMLMVGYRYPIHTLLPLLVLFSWQEKEDFKILHGSKEMVGWLVLSFFFLWQLPHIYYLKETKWDLRSYKYGVGMFDSNHQCWSSYRVIKKDGTVEVEEQKSRAAQQRCQLYSFWYFAKKRCLLDPSIQKIEWTYAHSINGSPFKKQVDAKDVCGLNYGGLAGNDWANPFSSAEVLGYPYPNYLHGADPDLSKSMMATTPQIFPTRSQAWLEPYSDWMIHFWRGVWVLVASLILFQWVKRER